MSMYVIGPSVSMIVLSIDVYLKCCVLCAVVCFPSLSVVLSCVYLFVDIYCYTPTTHHFTSGIYFLRNIVVVCSLSEGFFRHRKKADMFCFLPHSRRSNRLFPFKKNILYAFATIFLIRMLFDFYSSNHRVLGH